MLVSDLIKTLYSKNWIVRQLAKLLDIGYQGTELVTTQSIFYLGNFFSKINKIIKDNKYNVYIQPSTIRTQPNQMEERNEHDNGPCPTDSEYIGNAPNLSSDTQMRDESQLSNQPATESARSTNGVRVLSDDENGKSSTRLRKEGTSFAHRVISGAINHCKEERQLARDSRQLARDSRQLARDSRQLADEAIGIACTAIGVAASSIGIDADGIPGFTSGEIRSIEQTTVDVKSEET
ncbi:MAG: hypothetical protein ACRC80_26630 [Waterburya sp.]